MAITILKPLQENNQHFLPKCQTVHLRVKPIDQFSLTQIIPTYLKILELAVKSSLNKSKMNILVLPVEKTKKNVLKEEKE